MTIEIAKFLKIRGGKKATFSLFVFALLVKDSFRQIKASLGCLFGQRYMLIFGVLF